MVFAGQLVVLDLSAQWSSNSFSVAALSAVAAAQQVVAVEGELGYLVLDEAWSLLADPHALRWLQGSWKLARAKGLSHVLVLHRWSDVAAAGDVGSAHRERAQGLLRECETAWLFRQPPDEAREMAVALGLHRREERYLSALPKGAALVRYGAHRSIVRVRPDQRDSAFIDTDRAMRIRTPMNDRPSLGRRTYHGFSYGPRVRLARAQFAAHRRSDPGGQDLVAGHTGAAAMERRAGRDEREERRHHHDQGVARLTRRGPGPRAGARRAA